MTAIPARSSVSRPARTSIQLVLALAALLVMALAAISLLSLMLGTPNLSLSELGGIATGGGEYHARLVVLQLRLPRVLLGAVAGAMLALAGVLLQNSLRNPLAGPELLGVSAGASVVVAAITIFHLPILWAAYPWLALGGGMASGGVVLLTMRRVSDPVRLILMGVAVGALLYACVISIVTLGAQEDVGLLYLFLLGSLANRIWDHFWVVLPWAAVGIPLTLLAARPLNLLQLGDDMAEGLGLRVARTRLLIFLLAAGLVAAVVAVCGPIAFVSLVAPHIARRTLHSSDARQVLPIAALIGAVLLVGADLIGRRLFDPLELPVGIWTTLIGGPLLLILLRRQLSGSETGP